jgi:anti-anti-sigma regulatory factor
MAAQDGCVRVQRHDGTVTFRVEGWGTMKQSLPFRRVAERCLADGAAALHIDLRACTYLDSTFLGTLLAVKRAADRQRQGTFALVAPSAQCAGLLRQMALDRLFPVVPADECADTWVDVTAAGDDVAAVKGNVVDAHQQLAELPGPAGEKFRAVVHCLEQAAEAERGQGPSK